MGFARVLDAPHILKHKDKVRNRFEPHIVCLTLFLTICHMFESECRRSKYAAPNVFARS